MSNMTSEREITKVAFKIGDHVRLRSRFIQLFGNDSGVIVAVITDPIRSLFNEYAVEFPDRKVASLFQFQIYPEESAIDTSSPSQNSGQ